MADIEAIIDDENSLTVFTIEGELTAEEIVHYSCEYYDKKPTMLVLWDGTRGSVRKISNNGFQEIAIQMKNCTSKRKGGKTAFVGKSELDFGLGRVYEAFADIEQLPIAYRTFKTVEDAREWLFSAE
jgi:hypothetical protein